MYSRMKKKNFNIIISGVGGQGLITITKILAKAALIDGFDVKTSELHGLSQREGSVETAIRFGFKVDSPLIRQGGADLIISLELQEALKACYYASKDSKTIFLINDFVKRIIGAKKPDKNQILKQLRGFSNKIALVPATNICRKEFNKEVLAGVYLISLAVLKGLIPLKAFSVLKAAKKIIPDQYLELNLQTFRLAQSYTLSI